MTTQLPKSDLQCVREPDLRAYVLGELPSRVVRLVADHVSTCSACEAKARQLDKSTDPLIRGIRLAMRGDSAIRAVETVTNQPHPNIEAPTPPPGYETIRELGRGGMGVVYLARQRHPNRLIAIKVLLAGVHSGPAGRARFLAEADAIAKLQHPNIVQIFEVGEHGGLPFFALEYVEGGNLADRLNGQPQPPKAAAELVQTLAQTVHFAHQQSIVHRDLKPANILLQKDEGVPSSSVPKIADFGLAKHAGPELTATGELIGTPSYMAPEQATGGVVGPAADVWALGAILYECLTGRPPFRGASQLETLEQVRLQEAVPPEQLRPGLPRDLSTVCLKSLEKDPKRRYSSAADLADDLGRVLADRHPLARRSTQLERSWRWCRRNPLSASLAATIAALLPIALAVVSYWYWQSDAARRRAEQNFLRAGSAVQSMTEAGQKLFSQKGTEDIGRKIIEKAAEFHEGFIADKGDDPAVLLEAARGWTAAGMCRASLGQINAAMEANDRAIELYNRLLAADPRNTVYRFERANRLRANGMNHMRWTKDQGASELAFAESQKSLQDLYDSSPDDVTYAFNLSNTMLNHAEMLRSFGRSDQAAPLLEETVSFQQQCIAKYPTNRDFQLDLAKSQESLGVLLWARDQDAKGESLCREALHTYQELADEFPLSYDYKWYAARAAGEIADIAKQSGRLSEAEQGYRKALAWIEVLRRERPPYVTYAMSQLSLAGRLADALHVASRHQQADDQYRIAIALAEKIVADFPDELAAGQAQASAAHLPYADFLVKSGRRSDAVAVLQAAQRVWPSDSKIAEAVSKLCDHNRP
jgi:serine/threonine protein kinase